MLDTDHMSVLEWAGTPVCFQLETRLRKLPSVEVATSIVSYEEQVRGWLTQLAKGRQRKDQIEVYYRLKRQLENYCSLTVLLFDERAAVEFQRLKKHVRRIGTMDLKIAAIALSNQAILPSRNLRDFQQVPELSVEDWTK
jgi:tRNA(fMet)-specific endonuclease VapC